MTLALSYAFKTMGLDPALTIETTEMLARYYRTNRMTTFDSPRATNPLSSNYRFAGAPRDTVALRDAAADAGGKNCTGFGFGRSGSHFDPGDPDDTPRGPLGLPRRFRMW